MLVKILFLSLIFNLTIKDTTVDFSKQKLTQENVYKALIHYNIKYPKIVLAQAILETGHFKSNVCKKYNNLFGLYNSRIKDYYRFKHWSQSIIGYKNYIQYRYTNLKESYFNFLNRIGYAEDPNYIKVVQQIYKKL